MKDGKLKQAREWKVFKVIIAGGRDFSNHTLLREKCDSVLRDKAKDLDTEIVIVSGKAKGADYHGELYAKERNYRINEYPADWNKYGKRAGYLRNKEMAKASDALIAFWDGKSKGTKHMIDLAKSHGLLVRIIHY